MVRTLFSSDSRTFSGIYAGELHGDLEGVLVFGNIGRGEQGRGYYAALREWQAGKSLVQDPVEPLQSEQIRRIAIASDGHRVLL